jgi:hypothetical protein
MRDADEQNAAGCEEQNFEGDNSGQHRQCYCGRAPGWGGGRSGDFLEKFETNKRALPRLNGCAPKLNQWLIATRRQATAGRAL